MKFKRIIYILFSALFVITLSCEKDDITLDESPTDQGGATEVENYQGTIEFTVSGDVEGEFTGICDFNVIEQDNGNIWTIVGGNGASITGEAGDIGAAVSFSKMNLGSFPTPTAGDYSIGGIGNADFIGELNYIIHHGDSDYDQLMYSTMESDIIEGGLNLTFINQNKLKGIFSYVTRRVDGDNEVAYVQGEFILDKY